LDLGWKKHTVPAVVNKKNSQRLSFIATISQMGKDKHIIWISKRYHYGIVRFLDKQVRIQIDDEL
jgi:hypothetical protein